VAGEGVVVLLLLSLDTAVSLLSRVFSAVLIARQQFHRDNTVQLAAMGVRVAVTVVLLLEGWGLTALAVALLAGSLLRLSLTYFESRRIEKFVIRPTLLSWKHLRDVGSLGMWFSVGGLAGLMILSVDSILAAKLISIESVAVLYLTARLYDLAEGMFKPVVDVARPVLGALLGQGEASKAANAYCKLEGLTVVFALVLSASIWAVNEQFIAVWVGADNYGGPWLNTALAAAFFVNLWVLPRRAVLSAALVVKPQSLSRLGEGVVKILLGILLGGRFGLPGIVSATSLASFSNSIWYLERLVAGTFESLDVAAPFTLRMRPLVFVLVSMTAVAGWELTGALGGYAGVALGFIATASAASCVVLILGVDHGTRSRLPSLVRDLTKPAAGVESRA
jgi:O-antigen/teichoic acid export membrane protein